MGPTAAGKTAAAVELVEQFPFDIVSVDSALVYRGLDIGTAKPDLAVLTRAPHRLIDIVERDDAYSAGRFRRDALAAVAEIRALGRVPLLVGGTLLYFRAYSQGLAELPQSKPEIRAEIDAAAASQGWPALHAERHGCHRVSGRLPGQIAPHRRSGQDIQDLSHAQRNLMPVRFELHLC